MQYQVGDRIKNIGNNGGGNCGKYGHVDSISSTDVWIRYDDGSAGSCSFSEAPKFYEIINKKNIMSTLKEKLVLLVTPEPMKSRRKAGITDGDDYPTDDGIKAIMSWWLKNSPDAIKFDADVVKPIVDQMESDCKK